MKKVFLLLALSGALLTASAQKTEPDTSAGGSRLFGDTTAWKMYTLPDSAGSFYRGLVVEVPQSQAVYIYNRNMSEGRIIRIEPNGDMWYLPSAFCDCDKCKAHKGMKFVRNLFANN